MAECLHSQNTQNRPLLDNFAGQLKKKKRSSLSRVCFLGMCFPLCLCSASHFIVSLASKSYYHMGIQLTIFKCPFRCSIKVETLFFYFLSWEISNSVDIISFSAEQFLSFYFTLSDSNFPFTLINCMIEFTSFFVAMGLTRKSLLIQIDIRLYSSPSKLPVSSV